MYKYAKYMHENLVKLSKKHHNQKKNKNDRTKITIEPSLKCQKHPRYVEFRDKTSPRLQQLSGLLEKIADLEDFMNEDWEFEIECF